MVPGEGPGRLLFGHGVSELQGAALATVQHGSAVGVEARLGRGSRGLGGAGRLLLLPGRPFGAGGLLPSPGGFLLPPCPAALPLPGIPVMEIPLPGIPVMGIPVGASLSPAAFPASLLLCAFLLEECPLGIAAAVPVGALIFHALQFLRAHPDVFGALVGSQGQLPGHHLGEEDGGVLVLLGGQLLDAVVQFRVQFRREEPRQQFVQALAFTSFRLGILPRESFAPTERRMASSWRSSLGVTRVMAFPVLPARPVRPMRWT